MKLSEMLRGVADGLPDLEISGITADSRNVKPGFLFFCPATTQYAYAATTMGAVAVAIGETDEVYDINVPVIRAKDIRRAVSLAASRFYPRQPRNIAAVTGTNGKTSAVAFLTQIFEHLGFRAAGIGTLGVAFDGRMSNGLNTTPGAIELHRTLDDLARRGIDYDAFEASSHGLDQHSLDSVGIKAAGFTNLTRDHIDYHKDMDNYFQAKARLFTDILPEDCIAVLNADIPEFDRLKNIRQKIIGFGKTPTG